MNNNLGVFRSVFRLPYRTLQNRPLSPVCLPVLMEGQAKARATCKTTIAMT